MSKRNHNNLEIDNFYGDGNEWCRGPATRSSTSGEIFLATLKRRKSPRIITGRLPPVMTLKSILNSNSFTLRKEKLILDDLQESQYTRRLFGDEETIGQTGELSYNILLEYPSGGTLENLITTSGGEGLPESHVWHYTRSLLLGLRHLHDHGYVHRNLNPENIMLVHSDTSALCTAKLRGYESVIDVETLKKILWNPYTRMGIEYLSPEAFGRMKQGRASDVWAVGCIVYEMLRGKTIWDDLDKGYENIKNDLYKMRDGGGVMEIPDVGMSENAMKFLKACFEIKVKKRWSAKRLLNLCCFELAEIYSN